MAKGFGETGRLGVAFGQLAVWSPAFLSVETHLLSICCVDEKDGSLPELQAGFACN